MLPIISIGSGIAIESSNVEFAVTLSEASLGDVTVFYRTIQNGSALLDVDFDEVFGTLVIPAGQTSATISVPAFSDSPDDGDENFTIELSNPTNAILSGGQSILAATGVILDQDGSTFDRGLFVSDPTILETDSGTTQAVFEVRLSEAFGSTTSFNFATADGTATAGEDYVATTGSVTFAANQTVAFVTVDVLGDLTAETMETFSLVVTPNSGIAGGVADSTGVATILADDSDENLPVISILDAEVGEGDSIRFTVVLSEPSFGDVTVTYFTQETGSGSADTDFDIVFNTLTIPAGQTVGFISVPAFSDSPDDGDENFSLVLINPDNAVLAGGEATLRATGVIFDRDGSTNDRGLFVSDPTIRETDGGGKQAVFEIRLSEPSPTALILDYTTSDITALAGQDYIADAGTVTFAAGQTVASVAVDLLGDSLVETMESFALVVTPTTAIASGFSDSTGIATILDDDTDGGLPVISVESARANESEDLWFIVTLSEPSLADVTVSYRTVQDGSAQSDIDFRETSGTLVINAGDTVGIISVSTFSDSPDDRDENLTLELSDPTNGVLAGEGPVLTATGVIFDLDGSVSDRALFVSNPILLETDGDGQQAVFEIRLSEPFSGDLTLDYTTADGTALAGSDYIASSGTITFLAGETIASVAVDIIGDTEIEAMESFSLVVTTQPAIVDGIRDAAGVATIMSDDAVSDLPVISIQSDIAAEGESLRFSVFLSQPSLVDVTIEYRTVQDSSAAIDIDFDDVFSTITIPAGQTVSFISIPAFSDSPDDGDENFTIELFNPINGVLANGQPLLAATGTIQDRDGSEADLALSVTDPVLLETDGGAQQAVFEIRLSEASASDVTLNYTTVDGSAVAGDDYVAASGTVTFLAGQTVSAVSVDLIADGSVEAMEEFSLVVTPVLPIVNGVGDGTGSAFIIDDDGHLNLPVISIRSAVAFESDLVQFTVILSEPSLSDVTMSFETVQDGSATEGSDYRDTSGTLTIRAGSTVGTISVSSFSDSPDDGDENFSLVLSNANNATFAGGENAISATGVILDLDGSTQDRAIFVSDPTVLETDEGNQQVAFEIRLSEPNASDITVNYTTGDGTAVAGEDYIASSGTITFLAGQTVTTVLVDLIPDRVVETSEAFALTVTPVLPIFGSTDASGLATILNDDSIGVIRSGTNGVDVLSGTAGSDTLNGLGGADTLVGSSGGDVLRGGGLNDELVGGTGGDSLNGGSGNDLLYGGLDDDLLLGGGQFDTLFGGFGDDVLLSGQGNDILNGDGGDDTLNSGTGSDALFGGSGSDDLFGQAQADELSGGAGNDFLNGGDGTDTLFGGTDNDRLEGANGSDTLNGDAGSDTLYGGGQIDTLNGGNGDDELFGGGGDDLLFGDGGNDVLLGEGGLDTLRGGDGDDVLDGGTNADILFGESGDDILVGGNASDALNGGAGNDVLFGGGANDVLNGAVGDDTLFGGANRDTLNGGTGDDTLEGGGAADVFIFLMNSDNDVITDFQDDLDDLDLSGMGFDNRTQALSFASQVGDDVVFDFGSGDTLTIDDIVIGDLTNDLIV